MHETLDYISSPEKEKKKKEKRCETWQLRGAGGWEDLLKEATRSFPRLFGPTVCLAEPLSLALVSY